MPEKQSSGNASLYRFLFVTMVLGMGLQSLFTLVHKNGLFLVAAMWSPTVAVLFIKERNEIFGNLKKIRLTWICYGLLLGAAPYLIEQLVYLATGLGHWNSEMFVLGPDLHLKIEKAKLVFGNAEQSLLFFFSNLTLTLVLAATATAIFAALGEEIGWRGFLQEKLTHHKFGVLRGLILLGLIWGYWHIPCNLGGVNGKENVLLNTFVIFPLGVVFITFTIGWLRIRSGAIGPALFCMA